MSQPSQNPYSAPEADIRPEASADDPFNQFPRFSAWWVLALSIVTFTLFWYFWYFTRTNIINRVLPENQISSTFVWSTLGISAANILIDFVPWDTLVLSGFYSSGVYNVVYDVLNLTAIVLGIAWAFLIRDRINILSGARTTSAIWASGFLTFFAGAIYLAYKINQIKDSRAG